MFVFYFAATGKGKRKRKAPVPAVLPAPEEDSLEEIRCDDGDRFLMCIVSARASFLYVVHRSDDLYC